MSAYHIRSPPDAYKTLVESRCKELSPFAKGDMDKHSQRSSQFPGKDAGAQTEKQSALSHLSSGSF